MVAVSVDTLGIGVLVLLTVQLLVMVYGRRFSRRWQSLMLYWLIGSIAGGAAFYLAVLVVLQV